LFSENLHILESPLRFRRLRLLHIKDAKNTAEAAISVASLFFVERATFAMKSGSIGDATSAAI
jgi:hypothetical protein